MSEEIDPHEALNKVRDAADLWIEFGGVEALEDVQNAAITEVAAFLERKLLELPLEWNEPGLKMAALLMAQKAVFIYNDTTATKLGLTDER